MPRKYSKEFSRRGFLGLGSAAALGGLALGSSRPAPPGPEEKKSFPAASALPAGRPLRILPALTYQFWPRRKKTSWRSYGGLQTREEVNLEVSRIQAELKGLSSRAEFPLEILPVAPVNNLEQARHVAGEDCDVMVVYGAGGFGLDWLQAIAASRAPTLMFLRHKSGPYYLWHEIAHWRLLRRNGDTFQEPNLDVQDIVVDESGDLLWRLRALYGLKNARGTKMLAIGGLSAYSEPAQRLGPTHAREVWNYEIQTISEEEFGKRLQAARAEGSFIKRAEEQANELIAQPGVTLETDRKFVVNSFLALAVTREFLRETGATNFGFAHCMGNSVIGMLDTPPCLVLSLANDEGLTAYCHTDLSHTLPGVLLRWIAARPSFVCNTHFPHHGIFTVAHCAAPRRMNGRDFEPTRIMTHFESDHGAATKVEYRRGQVVTVVIPNLRCTRWTGFRGTILDSPSHPACRSQIDIQVEGNFRRLLEGMEGFHAQVVYGDFLQEVGYALKKIGKVGWENFSETA